MDQPAAKPRNAIAQHAASLIVLRDGPGEPHVLMGLRGAGHRFMPNRLVFPGGRVDPADHSAPCANPLPAPARVLLQKAARPGLAQALAIAAARELEEETGLTLGNPPDLGGMDYLCRAVTPPEMPIRFNARFLVVPADRVSGTLGGSGELEGLRWYGLNETLALDLVWITQQILLELRRYLALPPDARAARTRTPLFRRPGRRLE